MQAHANDLRVEVKDDWSEILIRAADDTPTAGELDALVHEVVRDWRSEALQGRLRSDVMTMLEYAAKVTQSPARCAPADIDRLRASGWSDEAIHDSVQVVAYFNYINRVADALGVALEPGLSRWGQAV